jgi:hypothetical protein
MKQNIETKGRIIRGCISLAFFGMAGASYYLGWPTWLLILSTISGVFVAFEATKGWCVARACGIKTKY